MTGDGGGTVVMVTMPIMPIIGMVIKIIGDDSMLAAMAAMIKMTGAGLNPA